MSGMVAMVVDIETLGSGPRAEILQIGAVAQPIDGSGVAGTHRAAVQAGQQGREIDAGTIAWWTESGERVEKLRRLFRSEWSLPLVNALTEFSRWTERFSVAEWWSFGQFDFPVLEDAYRQARIAVPWGYRALRDLRTMLAVTGVEMERNGAEAHDALADAEAEAGALRKAWEKVGNWRKEAAE